jgi:hypothetical protein
MYNGKIIAGQIRLLSAIKGKDEKAGMPLDHRQLPPTNPLFAAAPSSPPVASRPTPGSPATSLASPQRPAALRKAGSCLSQQYHFTVCKFTAVFRHHQRYGSCSRRLPIQKRRVYWKRQFRQGLCLGTLLSVCLFVVECVLKYESGVCGPGFGDGFAYGGERIDNFGYSCR